MMSKIVLALGGNALGNTPVEQLEAVKIAASTIVDLAQKGNQIAVVHGNGPQVGVINLGLTLASQTDQSLPEFPLVECVALSQGYIGYHLQQAINNEIVKRNLQIETATVVTQVVVDPQDPGFINPTKPIGNFYTKEEADLNAKEKGYRFVEDAGRGYRRVVPSPLPSRIVELKVIDQLFNSGTIVITGGGGGIPVLENEGVLQGVDAVIDKDSVAAKLSADLQADTLIILTAVEKVAINFNKPNQSDLDKISSQEAQTYIDEGHFAPGSMLPKVQASLQFVKENPKSQAIITSLEKADLALEGRTGTRIYL